MGTWTDENLGITSDCFFFWYLNKQSSAIMLLEDRGCGHSAYNLFKSSTMPEEDDKEYTLDIYMIIYNFFIPVSLRCLVAIGYH